MPESPTESIARVWVVLPTYNEAENVERLVTAVGQRGFRVAPLTSADVLDTINTRVVVEREALARSIATGGIEWETDLVAAYHSLSRIPIPHKAEPHADVWAQHHRRFHMALLAACGSSWLLELAGLLFDHAERHRVIRARTVPEPKLTRDIAAEHKEILAATLARKSKAAVQALERHYRATAEQVIAAFDQTVQKQKPK